MSELDKRSTIALDPAQLAVLKWIQAGCPEGVYPDDNYSHRISARALQSHRLIQASGHGVGWQATPTERGSVWPAVTPEDEEVRTCQERAKPRRQDLGIEPQIILHAELDIKAGGNSQCEAEDQ